MDTRFFMSNQNQKDDEFHRQVSFAMLELNRRLDALEHSRPKTEGETAGCYPSAHQFPAWFMDPRLFTGGSVTCVCGVWTLPVSHPMLTKDHSRPKEEGECMACKALHKLHISSQGEPVEPESIVLCTECGWPNEDAIHHADHAFVDPRQPSPPAPTETRYTRKWMINKWEIFKAGNTISTCLAYGEKDSLLVLEALNAYDRTLKGEAK